MQPCHVITLEFELRRPLTALPHALLISCASGLTWAMGQQIVGSRVSRAIRVILFLILDQPGTLYTGVYGTHWYITGIIRSYRKKQYTPFSPASPLGASHRSLLWSWPFEAPRWKQQWGQHQSPNHVYLSPAKSNENRRWRCSDKTRLSRSENQASPRIFRNTLCNVQWPCKSKAMSKH